MHKTIVITPPLVEPISLDEAKKQLRIKESSTSDDDHIAMLIKVARDRVEKFCNRFFTEQTVSIVYNEVLPDRYICLPYPDLTSVVQLSYFDSDDVETVIDSGDYTFNSESQKITSATTFPADAVSYKINVVTGAPNEYGGASIGMLMMLSDLYDLRVESVTGVSVSSNPAVENSIYPYRVELGV